MKIIYKNGDLLDADELYICQGCNAQGAQNSGLAKIIRNRWPHVYTEYRQVYEQQGNNLYLGQIIPVECEDKIVLNIITQEYYGRDPNVVYVSYPALRKAIRILNEMIDEPIAFPLIGSKLGNGKWSIISKIIEDESTNFQPVVYLLDNIIPED